MAVTHPGPCSHHTTVAAAPALRVQLVGDRPVTITAPTFDAAVVAVTQDTAHPRAPRQLTSLSVLRVRTGDQTAHLSRWACRTQLQTDAPASQQVDWTGVTPQICTTRDDTPPGPISTPPPHCPSPPPSPPAPGKWHAQQSP